MNPFDVRSRVRGRVHWPAPGAVVLWAGLTAVLALETLAGPVAARRPVEFVVGALLLALSVALARSRPLRSLVPPLAMAVSAPVLAYLGGALTAAPPFSITPFAALIPLGYLAGRRGTEPRPFLLLMAAAAVAGLVAGVATGAAEAGAFGAVSAVFDWPLLPAAGTAAPVAPWLLGRYRRQAADLVRAGWERAELLEALRRDGDERARLRERARIARDMHDSLGHDLSLIALRAAALEVAPGAAAEHREAAGALRADVAAAAERLRDVIGVLRPEGGAGPSGATDPGGASSPDIPDLGGTSGLAISGVIGVTRPDVAGPDGTTRPDISGLVDRAAAAGMRVELTGDGGLDGVPDTVRRAAHRIVQEGLTNAAKHAPGSAVTVLLRHTATATEVRVVNGAPDAPAPEALGPDAGVRRVPGTGTGLAAMAERARLLGGTLRAAPHGGGFAVDAVLPHRTDVAGPHSTDGGGTEAATAMGADGIGATGPEHVGAAGQGRVSVGQGRIAAGPGRVGGGPATESARQYEERRLRVRRGLSVLLLVPVAVPAAIGVLKLAADGAVSTVNGLDPAVYADLRVGHDRGEVERRLPFFRMFADPVGDMPAAPADAECVYYWSAQQTDERKFFRLCFAEDRLAAKDALPLSALSPNQ
ncbi:sensor histidine kinase [Nocardiopsis mangrovi]|uniref:histidine kinase n=1 Tax=Nocardiopsis mangrovi TaxID=1179818 RepID=A0ABV9DWH8_9ACTN